MIFLNGQLSWFLEHEEGRLFLWLPVFLALGIGTYFSLSFEPSSLFAGALVLASALAGYLIRYFLGWLILPLVIVAISSGFSVAKLRTETVRAPVIIKEKGFYSLEGRLARYVALPGKKMQLYLTDLEISRVQPEKTPSLIRITSRLQFQSLVVGTRVRVKAVLRRPPGPVRPGGFDFARQAWFSQLGAVGFAVSKAEIVKPAQKSGSWLEIERLRQIVSDKIRQATTGCGGSITLALIVGEKRSISKEVLSSIRAAGLAHMLAISGMHMALVSGTIFWVLQALLAMSQTLALSFDVRKIAAVGAILGAGSYFLLSGMGVATLRAFIMITIMFVAVLFGRKALSLRNVSLAALCILVFQPESVLSVGFQMSFASVVALVSFYESGVFHRAKARSAVLAVRVIEHGIRSLVGIFATTVIAGLAVAPIAVYHFHHITSYSIVGNVLAMPVLTIVVMPMALVGLIAMPFGLHGAPLWLMEQGNLLIIKIAEYVAGFEGARVNVGTIGFEAFLLIGFGGLWLCLWRSAYRFVGVAFLIAGFALAPFRATPILLVERDGKNAVLIDEDKIMWPVASRIGRYSIEKWRSAYGALAPTKRSRERQTPDRDRKARSKQNDRKWRCDQYGCTTLLKGITAAYSSHPGALVEDCARADILITTYPIPSSFRACARVKSIIDIRDLKKNGAYAIYLDNGEIKTVNSRQIRGQRPWSSRN